MSVVVYDYTSVRYIHNIVRYLRTNLRVELIIYIESRKNGKKNIGMSEKNVKTRFIYKWVAILLSWSTMTI